jgi:hypothetical protein
MDEYIPFCDCPGSLEGHGFLNKIGQNNFEDLFRSPFFFESERVFEKSICSLLAQLPCMILVILRALTCAVRRNSPDSRKPP